MKFRTVSPAVGASSLLVIFAVLCLTVFSMLCIGTALADQRLADASRDAVTAYYEADCAAEEILARLRAGEIPENVSRNGDIYSYCCRVSDTQKLQVSLRLTGNHYEILLWQVVPVSAWQADDTLPVYTRQDTDKE